MKIRFLKRITVDVENRQGEIYDKTFNHWQEIRIDEIFNCGTRFATIKTDNGEFLHGVPVESFERLKEEKKELVL